MNILVDDEIMERLRKAIASEDLIDSPHVRLRSFFPNCGGWGAPKTIVLGVTLDEKTEDDEALEMGGLSFIADPTFLSAQGNNFSIEPDVRTGVLRVIALDRVRESPGFISRLR